MSSDSGFSPSPSSSSMRISSISLSGVAGRLVGDFFLNILELIRSGPPGRWTGGMRGAAGGAMPGITVELLSIGIHIYVEINKFLIYL